MSDKYPSLTPYNYCAGNPMILVDPNGEEIWIAGGDGNSYRYENGKLFNKDGSEFTGERTGFLGKTTAALDKLSGTKMGSKLIGALQSNKNYKLDINSSTSSQFSPTGKEFETGNATNGLLAWNSNTSGGVPVEGNQYGCTDATIALGHELSHAYDNMCNVPDAIIHDKYNKELIKGEWAAVYRENAIRNELKFPLRTHYAKDGNAPPGQVIGSGPAMLDKNHKPYLPFLYPNIR
jgi:hypothetical protein